MSEYFSILTEIGLQKLAIAIANGETLTLSEMAFSNSITDIVGNETVLAGETYRMSLTRVGAVSDSVQVEAVIPMDVGGFWIRKIALFDDNNNMIAIGKYPATYKPLMTDGAVKELAVRMILHISNASEIIVAFNNGIIEGANTNLDNLTFVGQQKFDEKANLAAMLTALALKAPLESPVFTGTPNAPTASAGTNTKQVATTEFVRAAISALVGSSPASLDTLKELADAIGGDANFSTTITNALATKAALASPALTGVPTAPTAALGTATTQLATTEFVRAAVAALIGSSPAALDTLKELADAIGGDANFSTTITNALATKAALASPALTGVPTAPTAALGTATTQLATTSFVNSSMPVLITSVIRNSTTGSITITCNKTPTTKSVNKNSDGSAIAGTWAGLVFTPTTSADILDSDDWQVRVA